MSSEVDEAVLGKNAFDDLKINHPEVYESIQKIPVALEPAYSTPQPNSAIVVYSGPVQIKTDGGQLTCDARIFLNWLPTPSLRFQLKLFGWNGMAVGKEIEIIPATKSRALKAVITRCHMFGGSPSSETRKLLEHEEYPVQGVCGPYTGRERPAEILYFHLANFIEYFGERIRNHTGKMWTGRTACEADEWVVTIDTIDSETKLQNEIKEVGGFGITHAGTISKKNASAFSENDANLLLKNLGLYLSFVAGRWVSPILRVGLGANGAIDWCDAMPYRTARHKVVRNWFNSLSPDNLLEGFPGFLKRISDSKWSEPLGLALYWYLESNSCSGGQEGSVILAQTALELLSYEILVNERKCLSEEGFGKLPAADAIRLSLAQCGIPTEIPPQYTDLLQLAKAYNWMDGPAGIVEIRNSFIHSSPKKRARISGGSSHAILEGWQLAMWYLDMLLLHLIGFAGSYSDRRVSDCFRGEEVRKVPWLKV